MKGLKIVFFVVLILISLSIWYWTILVPIDAPLKKIELNEAVGIDLIIFESNKSKELTNSEIDLLDKKIRKLNIGQDFISGEPDLMLKIRLKDDIEESYYSIFLKKNILYPDDFLSAWSERQSNQESSYYILDEDVKKILINISNKK